MKMGVEVYHPLMSFRKFCKSDSGPFSIKLMSDENISSPLLDLDDPYVTRVELLNVHRFKNAQELGLQEWCYVFFVEFLIWWSLWAIIDFIPDGLGFKNLSDSTWLRIYLLYTLIGGVVYLWRLPRTKSIQTEKLKCFIGLVVLCCGLWGFLDTLTDILGSSMGINRWIVYILVFFFSSGMGVVHHCKYREDYLIDRLL